MDLLTIWFYVFPWISLFACVCLALIVVWMWFPRPNAVDTARKAGFRDGYSTGHKDGVKDGYRSGAEDTHLDEAHFLKCPEPGCDKAIEVPTIMHVDGDVLRCEPDTTEYWVHIEGHKAGASGHA